VVISGRDGMRGTVYFLFSYLYLIILYDVYVLLWILKIVKNKQSWETNR
jgi:hypothetical protein